MGGQHHKRCRGMKGALRNAELSEHDTDKETEDASDTGSMLLACHMHIDLMQRAIRVRVPLTSWDS